MAGPHQPSGLPDADLPHQKYMYVCMYVCMYVLIDWLNDCLKDTYTPVTNLLSHQLAQKMANALQLGDCLHFKGLAL